MNRNSQARREIVCNNGCAMSRRGLALVFCYKPVRKNTLNDKFRPFKREVTIIPIYRDP